MNVAAPRGRLAAEILDAAGKPVAPFTRANCLAVSTDSTRAQVSWKGADELSPLAGKPVRFRFWLSDGRLYAFWVSADQTGASRGFVAAGGPGFEGPRDTIGCRTGRSPASTTPGN